MKLRILGNSIRLRLSQSDVRQFRDAGHVSCLLDFGDDHVAFSYSLQKQPIEHIQAEYDANGMRVLVPADRADQWAQSDAVGMSETVRFPNGQHLRILIEKDFQCLKARPHEDESDLFPNPLADQSAR